MPDAPTKRPAFHDEVTIEEEVASLASIETVVVAGEIPKSSAPDIVNEPLGDPSKVRSDVGGFDYRFATTPLVGLAASHPRARSMSASMSSRTSLS